MSEKSSSNSSQVDVNVRRKIFHCKIFANTERQIITELAKCLYDLRRGIDKYELNNNGTQSEWEITEGA